MWLLPVLSGLSRFSARTFYRLTVAGEAVPATGPVLLVANHPNSLVDPVLLACAAGRPVRFLAKAPLFDDPKVGFLVRGSGAIPVYRRVDDPGAMRQNEDMFRAAHDALAEGSVVGLFPEGISHSEPSLQPLKTGAARLALGAVASGIETFPIVPVGIVLRDRETFRSQALVVVGDPVEWEDMAGEGPEDREAVRLLTERVENALHGVTLNLEQWEDEPLVATAEAVWSAETAAGGDQADRVARLERTTTVLRAVRSSDDTQWRALAGRLHDHRRKLAVLGLSPATLVEDVGLGTASRWTASRIPMVLAMSAAVLGSIVFWPPYRLVGWWVDRQELATDVRATHKLLGGTVIMIGWVASIAMIGGMLWGWPAVVAAAVGLPLIGLATLSLRDRWRDSWRAARRYLLLRNRTVLRDELRAEQGRLADELDAINRRYPEP